MNGEGRKDILKSLLLSLWGMATLVLFFVVLLLVREMLKNDQDPLAALRSTRKQPAAQAPKAAAPVLDRGSREVTLFFGTHDGRYLAPERRPIAFTDSTVENCRAVLQELIAGPGQPLVRILPAAVTVRALYLLEDGELVVDLSRDLLSAHARFKSAALEALLVYGIVNTVTQAELQAKGDTAVRRVRFLIEDLAPPETFPAHVDLSRPVLPDARWNAGEPLGDV